MLRMVIPDIPETNTRNATQRRDLSDSKNLPSGTPAL